MAQPGQPNFQMKLDAEDLEILKRLAKRAKTTRSDLVRRAIRKLAIEAGELPPEAAIPA